MTVAVNMICSKRDARRLEVDIDATLRGSGVHMVDVEIEDISVSGFRMATSVDLKNGELITIGLAGLGMQPAVVVRRMSGRYGCQFINSVSQNYVDQLQFGVPTTVTPFASAASINDTGAKLTNENIRIPIELRIGAIFLLGVASWGIIFGILAIISHMSS